MNSAFSKRQISRYLLQAGRNFLLFLLITISFISCAYAQKGQEASLPEALESFLQRLRKTESERLQGLADTLELQWASIPPDAQASFLQIIQMLTEKRVPLTPYIQTYLEGFLAFFRQRKIDVSLFPHWHEYVEGFVQHLNPRNRPRFLAYLRFLKYMFQKNALFSGAARTWFVDIPQFRVRWIQEYHDVEILIPRTTLTGIATNDTLQIYEVEGTFRPYETRLYIKAGARVYWEGMPRSVYVELSDFTLNVKTGGYRVDTAWYHNPRMFSEPVLGRFEDRLVPRTGPPEKIRELRQRDPYPQFLSYKRDLELSIHPLVEFRGGIGIRGQRLFGYSGDTLEYGTLYLYRNEEEKEKGKPLMVFQALKFWIVPQVEVIAERCRVRILLTDSHHIEHPGAFVKIDLKRHRLSIERTSVGLGASAFLDTYHQLEFMPEKLGWRFGSDTLTLEVQAGVGKVRVPVVSLSYFDQALYDSYMRATDYNPLGKLALYAEKAGYRELYVEEVRDAWNPRLPLESVRRLLYKMVEHGFVDFDPVRGIVHVREKLMFYMRANQKRVDYDYLFFSVLNEDPVYGYILLPTLDLVLEGVEYVMLSRKQRSSLIPLNRRVIVRKNRDMLLEEALFYVGRFVFWGRNLRFDYERFAVDVGQVDSLIIRVPTGEYTAEGREVLRPLRSVIENLQAEVFIDAPNNKSGRYDLKRFPIMRSKGPSYIYYDKPYIQEGNYVREKFFIRLDPFVFDSLNSFNPLTLNFAGTFISGGILPELRVQVNMQEDSSLGFRMPLPVEGLNLYGGKGKLFSQESGEKPAEIHLSNQGLWTYGSEVEYLSARLRTDSFLFLLEEMRGEPVEAQLTETDRLPDAHARDLQVSWYPYRDELHMTTTGSPFQMYTHYKGGLTYEGALVLEPGKLSGFGKIRLAEGEFISPLFVFENPEFYSDTASSFFHTTDSALLALQSPHVRLRVNMQERVGHFESNYGEFITEYVLNRYRTNFNVYDWYIDDRRLEFYSSKGPDDYGYFISTDVRRKNLTFWGTRAIYSLESKMLTVRGVEYVPVADARIYPRDSTVRIRNGGAMERLLHARILFDTLMQAHRVMNASVYIHSRFRYWGRGWYPYIHPYRTDTQYVRVDTVFTRLDTAYLRQSGDSSRWYSWARGTVSQDSLLELYPSIQFFGRIFLIGGWRLPYLDGFAWYQPENEHVTTTFFSFADTIDPSHFFLPYWNSHTPSRKVSAAGFHHNNITLQLYATITDAKTEPHEQSVLMVEGWLTYTPETRVLRIHPSRDENERLNALDQPFFVYDDEAGEIRAGGPLHLFRQMGLVEIRAGGIATHPVDTLHFEFRSTMVIQMPVDPAVLSILAQSIQENIPVSDEFHLSDPDLIRTVLFLYEDTAERQKILEDIQFRGTWNTRKIAHALILADLHLFWDTASRSFYHVGPAYLVSIGGKELNIKVSIYLQIRKKRSGDELALMIELNPETWYFIRYRNNVCEIYGTDPRIRETILNLKRKQRRIRDKATRRVFILMPTTEQISVRFKQKFLQQFAPPEEAEDNGEPLSPAGGGTH